MSEVVAHIEFIDESTEEVRKVTNHSLSDGCHTFMTEDETIICYTLAHIKAVVISEED